MKEVVEEKPIFKNVRVGTEKKTTFYANDGTLCLSKDHALKVDARILLEEKVKNIKAVSATETLERSVFFTDCLESADWFFIESQDDIDAICSANQCVKPEDFKIGDWNLIIHSTYESSNYSRCSGHTYDVMYLESVKRVIQRWQDMLAKLD